MKKLAFLLVASLVLTVVTVILRAPQADTRRIRKLEKKNQGPNKAHY